MKIHRLLILPFLASALWGTVAVAADQAPPAPAGSAGPAEPGPSAGAPGVGADYVIGPGDTLEVFVWRNPEFTTRVPVRPDGKISTPLVEDMAAVGKTPTQLARDIEQVLSEFVRSPRVNVIVTTAVSANSQIRVVGQAASPRAIAYREGMTVLDVIIEVGGLGEFAAGNRAKLVRKKPDGTTEERRLKLKDLVDRGDMRQNVTMMPGDIVIIPESRF